MLVERESRRRWPKLVLAAACTALVLAAAGFWWVVVRDDTPDAASLVEREIIAAQASAPTVTAGDTTPATTVAAPDLDGAWTLAPGPEVWVGYRITEHVGGFDNVAVARTGDIDAELTVEGMRITSVVAQVEMGTLVSQDTEVPGVGNRAEAMRTEGLETDLHPTATFTLTEPIDLGRLPGIGAIVDTIASGTLDLHGVERVVEIPISARWNGEFIDVSGSLEVALADHDIDPPAPQVVTVADTGTFEFQLTFVPA